MEKPQGEEARARLAAPRELVNHFAARQSSPSPMQNRCFQSRKSGLSRNTRVFYAAGAPDMTGTPITIKKYANRRLYNTASSAYVTLADLAKMVKSGEDFVVFDAKTNEDITRSVLTQIIFEQEGVEGQSLLPIAFLRQVIRFYGDSVQTLLPSYLEYSIDRFSGEQQNIRDQLARTLDPSGSFSAMQELTRKNFAAFNKALGMFSPFPGNALPPAKGTGDEIDELRNQLSDMKRRLDEITEKK
jgi:polyhydroxyalkanoate synthesis repressor PhaR